MAKIARPPVVRANLELDAREQTLGRRASNAAKLLMGKHKPSFDPSRDCGDFVTVTHADKIRLTGRKLQQHVYHDMSGYPGGIRTRHISEMLPRNPGEVVRRTVYYMLPKNRLRNARMKRLRITR